MRNDRRIRRGILRFALLALAALTDEKAVGEEPERKPAATTAQLQCMVVLYGRGSGGILQATGVIVDAERKWAVTAWHFWSSVDEARALSPIWADGKLVTAPTPYMNRYFQKKSMRPRLVWCDLSCDLALIEIPDLGHSTAARIGRGPVAASESLFALGNPSSRNAMWETSKASSRENQWAEWTYESGQRIAARMLAFDVSEPLSSGFSGGPVFNASGELVGITIASAKPDGTSGYAIDARTITRFIARAFGQQSLRSASKNNWPMAKRQANLAIATDSRDPWGYVVRGSILVEQDRPLDALEDFESAARNSSVGSAISTCRQSWNALVTGCARLGPNERRVTAGN